MVSLEALDKESLIRVLTEPKNALVKQYQKLFMMDEVELSFTACALEAIANRVIDRKTGARGLRAILENAMLDIMYDIPSEPDILEVVINEKVITLDEKPLVVYQEEKKEAS